MKKSVIFSLSLFFSISVFSQIDSVGSGRSIFFDGVNDYIHIGHSYPDLNLPFSVSAWVFVDPSLNAPFPIFVTNDTDPLYRGFWFFISDAEMWCEFGDGTGGNNPAFRRGKRTFVQNVEGRWHHVTAVMKAPFDMQLYFDGVNVGGNSTGGSNLPMASPILGDSPKIGYFLTNNGFTYYAKGRVDEVRLWNRALTETEVRQGMCRKLTGDEAGLVGYWTFDETSVNTLLDKSPNEFHGQLMNNPTRIYSGAPIGDTSVYVYTNNWSGQTVNLQDGPDEVIVSDITGNPSGVHIYEVETLPSQMSGLDLAVITPPYFGVFATHSSTFDINYEYQNIAACKLLRRSDNSEPLWIEDQLQNVSTRTEFIKENIDEDLGIDLGPDQVLCNQASRILSTSIDPVGKAFLWNTGATSPTIVVSTSGIYSVQVSQGCNQETDSLDVAFLITPPQFNLGDDEILCSSVTRVLTPLTETDGFNFTWQDGSTLPTYEVVGFGTYWVEVENICGISSDTIRFTQFVFGEQLIPNIITPNGDLFNESFIIDPFLLGSKLVVYNRWGGKVYESLNYQNDWDASDLAVGVYFYRLIETCIGEKKGMLTVIR